MLEEIGKLTEENENKICDIIMECDTNVMQQLLLDNEQLKQKIVEANFIINGEPDDKQEKKEDEQKEELLIVHEETKRLNNIINNLSDSDENEDERDRDKESHEPPIPRAPNISENENKQESGEEEQDDDVHKQEELLNRVNELREKTREKIVDSVNNEIYVKDNPMLGNLTH